MPSTLPPGNFRPNSLLISCASASALRARLEQMLAAADEAEAFITDLPDDESGERKSASLTEFDPADVSDEIVGQKIGRYKLLERIGEGGIAMTGTVEEGRLFGGRSLQNCGK